MAVVEVRIGRMGEGSQFTMAAARARNIAEEGDVAKVYMAHDRKAANATYVWHHPTRGIVVEPATILAAEWTPRLERMLQGDAP